MSAKSINDVLVAAAAMDTDDSLHLAHDLIVRAGQRTGITATKGLIMVAAVHKAIESDWEIRWSMTKLPLPTYAWAPPTESPKEPALQATRTILAALEAIEPAALTDDGEREAFRAAVAKSVQILNAGTLHAHGGVHYELQCAEA
jgi:hypothetical protein